LGQRDARRRVSVRSGNGSGARAERVRHREWLPQKSGPSGSDSERTSGENDRDGHSDNRSWNCGVEGPTDDGATLALRRRQMRNVRATLLLAEGTPMLLAGDEFARTERGNNNADCQGTEISRGHWTFDAAAEGMRRRLPLVVAPRDQPRADRQRPDVRNR